MKTEVKLKYGARFYRVVVSCPNPCNAGAVVLRRLPRNWDPSDVEIINCVGYYDGDPISLSQDRLSAQVLKPRNV